VLTLAIENPPAIRHLLNEVTSASHDYKAVPPTSPGRCVAFRDSPWKTMLSGQNRENSESAIILSCKAAISFLSML
jgi:hypothetical protein